MENNSTIHIFGYGETQINSKNLSIKVATASLTKVQAIIDALWSKKPAENEATEKAYYAINIFNKKDIRWQSKQGFSIIDKEAEITPLIDELIAELQVLKNAEIAK